MASESQRVKLILTYDIIAETQDRYYQYILGEMVPAAQALGLQMAGAWHTAYGDHPVRLVEFIGENREDVAQLLASPAWRQMEERLQEYVVNYKRKLVRLHEGRFQF